MMSPHRLPGAIPACIAALMAAGVMSAQVTPQDTDESVIELSPFIVDSDQDVGWLATSSLAGSRLNTPLRDTGASINVLTSEFLMDIGAIDMSEAIDYAVNMHETITREDSTNDNFAMEFFDAGRINIRGLPATNTRNYYRWRMQTDNYNVDRIEENRGPNSILFGIGSAAGVINSLTKRANLNREHRRGSLTYGSHDSIRATVDVNQVLLDGKLAVRLNAVHSNQGSWRQHVYNNSKRIHLATTWQVRDTTRLRADYEVGEIKQVSARGIPAANGVSTWLALGSPLYDEVQTSDLGAKGLSRFNNNTRMTYVHNLDQVLNFAGTNRSIGNNHVILDQSLVDLSVNQGGPGQKRNANMQNLTLFFEEQLGDRTFLEISHNMQIPNSDATLIGQGAAENAIMYADPMTILPNGEPNPFAGGFIFDGRRSNRIEVRDKSHATRAMISHELDLGVWGNYRLAGMAEYEWRNHRRWVWTEAWEGAPFHQFPENDQNRVFRRHYVTLGDWSTYNHMGPGETGLLQDVPHPDDPNQLLSSTWVIHARGAINDPTERQRTLLTGVQARYWRDRIVLGAGFRKDKLDLQTLLAERDPVTNEWTLDHDDVEPVFRTFNGTTRTLGIVGHATRNISLFYNFSNSVDLPNTQHRILPVPGVPPPTPEARGQDFGIGLSFFEGRLAARANAFTVDLVKSTPAGFGGTFSNPNVLNNRVLNGLLAAEVITQDVADARRFDTNTATRDRKIEGYEFNLTGALTSNWMVTANYSYTDGFDSEIAPEIKAWAEEAIPFFMQHADVMIQVEGDLMPVSQEVARWEANAAQEWLREGDLMLGNRKHKYSFFTRYTFNQGPLEGLFVGGGYRHQSRAPTNFSNDILRWSNSFWEADALVGYRLPPMGFLKRGARIQLNVRNLFNDNDPRITRIVASGDEEIINRVSLRAPRTWRVSANFDF